MFREERGHADRLLHRSVNDCRVLIRPVELIRRTGDKVAGVAAFLTEISRRYVMTHHAGDAIARQCAILLLRIVRRSRPLVDDVASEGLAKRHVCWRRNPERILTFLRVLSGSIYRQLALTHNPMTMHAGVLHASRLCWEGIGLT